MNTLNILKILQIIFGLGVIVLTLIQSKGTGLTSGLKSSFSTYRSIRGIEKIVFIATVVFGVLLVANSLAIVVLS